MPLEKLEDGNAELSGRPLRLDPTEGGTVDAPGSATRRLEHKTDNTSRLFHHRSVPSVAFSTMIIFIEAWLCVDEGHL